MYYGREHCARGKVLQILNREHMHKHIELVLNAALFCMSERRKKLCSYHPVLSNCTAYRDSSHMANSIAHIQIGSEHGMKRNEMAQTQGEWWVMCASSHQTNPFDPSSVLLSHACTLRVRRMVGSKMLSQAGLM